MKLDNLPRELATKLLRMSEQVRELADQRDKLNHKIDRGKRLISGNGEGRASQLAMQVRNYTDTIRGLEHDNKSEERRALPAYKAAFKAASDRLKEAEKELENLREAMDVRALVTRHGQIEDRCRNEEQILASCQSWLKGLPEDAKFEFVEVRTKVGDTLSQCRGKLMAALSEIQTLRSVPTPSEDIREPVTKYVEALAVSAAPQIEGVGMGERLQVLWPPMIRPGFSRETNPKPMADALQLVALLFGANLVEAIMERITEQTRQHGKPEDRSKRIAELTATIDELRYVEEVLVYREHAPRLPGSEPRHVLGVKLKPAVVESKPALKPSKPNESKQKVQQKVA